VLREEFTIHLFWEGLSVDLDRNSEVIVRVKAAGVGVIVMVITFTNGFHHLKITFNTGTFAFTRTAVILSRLWSDRWCVVPKVN
jgi:hypothetical protein